MDELDKRLADVTAQQSDFSRWLADYLVKSNKTGALEESLNAFAYAMYSTDTTNSEYLNNVSKLEELGLQSTAKNLVFQGILTKYSPDLSTFYTSYPQFAQYQYVLEQVIQDGTPRMSQAEEQLATDLCRTGGAACWRWIAVVITNPSLQKDFRYLIKQKGGMLAKGRLLGIQFKTLFTDNLYFRLAKKTVDQALRIRQAFQKKGIAFHFDSYTNQQFPILTQNQREHFVANYKTSFWQQLEDGRAVVRFCTSWATTDEAVDELVADIERMNIQ